ncbi:MAG: hypothetical protein ACREP6_11410 [Candidatus Binataceae bacterium]
MNNELLMIGSVPLETVEEVFQMFGGPLGSMMPCMPDGEVGDRQYWVDGVAYRVFNGHPELETLSRPAPDNGVERWRPRSLDDEWSFRVRKGVAQVRFGDPGWRLGFTKDAVNSYFIFRKLKEEGALPREMRFQVSMPLTNSAIVAYFHDSADFPRIVPGFEAAMRAEVAKMIEKIPPNDLAIQWDCALEIGDLEGELPYLPKDGAFERNVAPAGNLSRDIPEEVMLGYHLCFGTLGGWPVFQPKDLTNSVRFANAIVAESGRRVDFVHVPSLNRADDAFYAPLRDLKVGKTRVFLGEIHDMEDMNSFRKRLATARKYLPDFGLAAPCGFGRIDRSELPGILKDHLRAIEAHREMARR